MGGVLVAGLPQRAIKMIAEVSSGQNASALLAPSPSEAFR
jgi:hypothetical protein